MNKILQAGRFVRRHAAGLSWAAFTVAILTLTYAFPAAGYTLLALELFLAMAIWSAYFYVSAQSSGRDAFRMREERDRERQTTSALRELIHQHHLATIRDRDCGPDAYQRAAELAEASRLIMFPDYYVKVPSRPAEPIPVDEPAEKTHPFRASFTGQVCERMVMRDGGGDACGKGPGDPIHATEAAE